ncbi:hypothetical protein HNV12_10135 [Methanococcoides sp. SA1]|nr:hypothetical protein [Methanococcoides sp. SA1]
MKLSNKILIGILALVILFQFFTMLKFRGVIKQAMSTKNEIHRTVWNDLMDSEIVEESFDQTGFNKLKIQLHGNVVIKQSDEYKITVKAPEKLLASEYFSISKDGKLLSVKCPNYRKSNNEIDVIIFMPDLTQLKASEDLEIKVEGFSENHLDMTLTGEVSVKGYDNAIRDLDIDGFGEISVDFEDCKVDDANVRTLGEGEYYLDVENLKITAIGESDFDLEMRGGKITGNVIGEGDIRYSGDLKRENVTFLGPGKVKQK